MKRSLLLILTAGVMLTRCQDVPYGMPLASPIITAYPCKDSRSIVAWYDTSLSPKERNQYYLFANQAFPVNVTIVVKFSANVIINMNVKTDNNTYGIYSLRDGVSTSHRYRSSTPGDLYYGYKVKGTSPGKFPYLTSFKVNGVEHCKEPDLAFLNAYTTNNIDDETPINCGRRKIVHTELIVNGDQTKPGDWPWHAAIYKFVFPSIKYICGGSLLSTHFVLTAAHCTCVQGVPVVAEILSVVLGKYNLFGGDIGSQEREVHRIIIHEQFSHRYLHNDIALLKLKTEAVFTDYIQPACLWYSKASEKLLSDQILGTIVGWGYDSNARLSRSIKRTKMPIVSDSVCMSSNPNFYTHILNYKKFCAGYRNATSACNGDSGGAFLVFIPDTLLATAKHDSSGTWLVRGIVSLTLTRENENICDPNQYVVFTDVAKYLTWIKDKMDDV